jgi:hypothetical protein
MHTYSNIGFLRRKSKFQFIFSKWSDVCSLYSLCCLNYQGYIIGNNHSCKYFDHLISCAYELFILVYLLSHQPWITQPEMKQLCTYFHKLKKLRVCGIFVEFDILWTTAFLVAAPCVEMLHIEVMQPFSS